ncbi:MAG: hypothetical protein LBH54_05155, partial [Clostridiales bacterium]|nr:hypothetical protein [Clostridiales bacterium]
MKLFKRLIVFAVILALCTPYAPGIGELPALAADFTLYPYETMWVRDNNRAASVNSETMVVDNRTTGDVRRMSYMRFDFSEYVENLDLLETVQLRIMTHGDATGNAMRFQIYLLTPELTQYESSGMLFGDATAYGLTDYAENIVYTSPTGLSTHSAYTTPDLLPQIKALGLDAEHSVLGFKIASLNGAFSLKALANTPTENRPRLIVSTPTSLDKINGAAAEMEGLFPPAVSEDVRLPASVPGVNDVSVTWTSNNPESISDSGVILSRNGFYEGNSRVSFTAAFACQGTVREFVYPMEILKSGSYLGGAVSAASGSAREITFHVTDPAPEAAGYMLKIPNVYLEQTREYILYAASDEEIKRFTPAVGNVYSSIHVSDYVTPRLESDGGDASFTLVAADGAAMNESTVRFILEGMDIETKSGVEAVDALDLGDLSGVTANLSLPTLIGGSELSWQSSNPQYLSHSGRVDRPYGNEGDANLSLTVTYEGGGYVYTRTFAVTVLKQAGGGEAFPPISDPQHIKDADFFGVWNDLIGRWDTAPILRYDLFPDLNRVEGFAKKGDYAKAKDALLAYYRSRSDASPFSLPNADMTAMTNFLQCDMVNEKILSFLQMDNIVGMLENIGEEWGWHTITINTAGSAMKGALLLVDSDMNGTTLEIESKETPNGHPAYLDLTLSGGVNQRLELMGDTYVSAGQNRNKNYGGAELLYCREKAESATMPISTDTARPYFRFDIPSVTGTITSMKFSFYGRSVGGAKKVFAFASSNEKEFIENRLTWDASPTAAKPDNAHFTQVFNYKETDFLFIPPGKGAGQSEHPTTWHTEYEWNNYGTRMYQVGWLIARYRATGSKVYAYRALELCMKMYQQQKGGNYPRTLEGAWRTEYLMILFFGTIDADFLTSEALTAQLKYIYVHME